MILLQLFLTFLKIGLFTFGGGYAMVALIQNEVVATHGWLTLQEFTDIVAISQMTPGPLGINAATYVGYTATLNAGYSLPMAFLGAALASVAVLLLPVALMLVVCRYLQRYSHHPCVRSVLAVVKLAVVGLIASAALTLLTPDTFGPRPLLPILLCVAVFLISVWPKRKEARLPRPGPIALILLSALAGLLFL